MRRIGQAGLLALIALGPFARADISSEQANATNPLSEGVPEVAAVRLQVLLGQNLSLEEWRAVAEKLAEELVASKRPADAVTLLADARLR